MREFKAGNYSFELGNRTYIMGILNLTPDSFSDGGLWNDPNKAINRALQMQRQGADIIDIGAQSTRPGCTKIEPYEELKRFADILPLIRKEIDIPISIDTFYPSVAKVALDMGADIINDVTGFEDDQMVEVAKNSECGCIVMHSGKGLNIKSFFERKLKVLKSNGITDSRICFDPGIGFGKTYEENLYIIKNISDLCIDGHAMLIATSRKRVIGMSCDNPPFNERMPGTIAAHTIAVLKGADIIRVHDVKEAVQAARVTDAIKNINLKGGFYGQSNY